MNPRNRIFLDQKITSGKRIKITEKLAHYLDVRFMKKYCYLIKVNG